jgi:XTP/dITP diphosphohydrolase
LPENGGKAEHAMFARLVIATSNPGKLAEFQEGLGGLAGKLETLPSGFASPEETGTSFAANARIKARAACAATGLPALADDSGLCVDALGGEPGVHSARYAGLNQDPIANRAKLLAALAHVPDERRTARFVAALVLVTPAGEEWLAQAECAGRIARVERGINGFGYDPVFLLGQSDIAFAEMDSAQKRAVSHRGKAIAELRQMLALRRP